MKPNKLTAIFAGSLLLLSSCNLDEEPYGFYSEDNFFKTEADAQAALHYAYSSLTYIEYSRSIFFIGDMPTEMLTTKGDASVDNRALNTWNVANFPSNVTLTNFFKYSFIGINRANAVIKKVPGTDMDATLRDQYLGEAYFLRAYNYFCLARNFGLVPLHKDLVETIDHTATPLASNMDEIFNLIFEDCKLAESLLPVYATPVMGRIDRVAAEALLAKAYLYAASAKEHGVPLFRDMAMDAAEMYRLAQTYAGRVIGEDPDYAQTTYGFEPNLLDIYDVEKPFGREHIFLMSMDRTGENEGEYSKISKMFLPYVEGATIYLKQGDTDEFIPSHDGWGEYQTELDFYNSYETGDLRRDHLIATRTYNASGELVAEWKPNGGGNLQYPFCRKYIDPKFEGDKTSTRPFLLRYSDVALIYAEAAGPTPKAYELVNYIRRRAGLDELPAGLSISDFREAIYSERKFEMAFEGDRMYDIRRWNRIGDIYEVQAAGLNESQYTFFPLPQTETTLNPALR